MACSKDSHGEKERTKQRCNFHKEVLENMKPFAYLFARIRLTQQKSVQGS